MDVNTIRDSKGSNLDLSLQDFKALYCTTHQPQDSVDSFYCITHPSTLHGLFLLHHTLSGFPHLSPLLTIPSWLWMFFPFHNRARISPYQYAWPLVDNHHRHHSNAVSDKEQALYTCYDPQYMMCKMYVAWYSPLWPAPCHVYKACCWRQWQAMAQAKSPPPPGIQPRPLP